MSDLSETVSTPSKRQSTVDSKNNHLAVTDDPERCYSESSATDIPIGIHIEPISRQTTSAEVASNQPIFISSRLWQGRNLFGWKNSVLHKVWPRKPKSSTEIQSLTRADTNHTFDTSTTLAKPPQAQYGDLSRDISAYHDTNLSIVHTSEDVRRRCTGISASNSDSDIQLTIHSSTDPHNATLAWKYVSNRIPSFFAKRFSYIAQLILHKPLVPFSLHHSSTSPIINCIYHFMNPWEYSLWHGLTTFWSDEKYHDRRHPCVTGNFNVLNMRKSGESFSATRSALE